MKDLYSKGELFDSAMFNTEADFKEYKTKENSKIQEYISFKTFCLFNGIDALKKSGKSEDEIVDIILKKYREIN